MPSSQEIAKVMAEMDRFNQSAKVTVTEERYEKRVASVGGSYGGLTALLQQGAPGNWASDHKSEAEKFAGWHYVAISSIGKAIRSASVEAYQEKVREYAKAYNEQDDDSTPLPKWHPLMQLLKRPNPSQSGASFREEVSIQLCLTGSALIWNVPNQIGRTVERYVIPTAIAEPRQPEKGRPRGGWYINPEVARWQIESGWFLYTGLATAIGKVIDARDVQVIRFIHPVFKDEGQSPVSAGALWTDTSEKVDVSRHSHLRNGSDPSVIIGIDGVEDEGTLQRMSAKFNEKYAGPSKHGKAMFVNGQNVKVEPVTRTPAEMAYEGAFLQFRDAIMALHGVTPIAAGIEAPSGDDGLYAPLKQFISGTVQPILDLMAEEDTEQLAGQFGEGISVLYTAKAIDDAKLTEQQINTDILAGAIEVDEIRKLRGRKPWGGEKGKAVAGQGAKEEPKPGLPGLAQGVPGLEPKTGSQALDPSKPPQGTPDSMKLAEEAVAKALGGFADRLSALLKTGSDCGANGPGGGGFQPGNTCGRDDGSGESGGEKEKPKKGRTVPEAVDGLNPKSSRFVEDIKERAKEVKFSDEPPPGGDPEISEDDVFERLSKRAYEEYSDSGAEIEAFDEAAQKTKDELDRFASNASRDFNISDEISELAVEKLRSVWDEDTYTEGYYLEKNLNKAIDEIADSDEAVEFLSANESGNAEKNFSHFIDRMRDEAKTGARDFDRYIESHRQDWISDWENDNYTEIKNELIQEALDSGEYDGDPELNTWYTTGATNQLDFETNSGARYSVSIEDGDGKIDSDLPRGAKAGWLTFTNEDGSYKITGEQASKGKPGRGEQMQVFRGVASSVLAKLENDGYDAITYSAAEESRQELYDKLTVTVAQASPKYVAAVVGGYGTGGEQGTAMYYVVKREHKQILENALARDQGKNRFNWLVKRYAGGISKSHRDARGWVVLLDFFKSSSCGANGPGGGGFQPGNTCGKRDGKGGESSEGGGKGASVNPKILAWAREKFGDDTTAENFAKWFGDSKVVDEEGNPLVVYHGTRRSSGGKIGQGGFAVNSVGVVSAFFDMDAERADGYAVSFDESFNERKDGVIIPAFLAIKNPKVFKSEYNFELDAQSIKKAKDEGYDGYSASGRVFLPFSPTQIKSATGNSGTFDPKDPNITKSGSGCGANAEGGGGFQRGNTCGSRDGGDSEGSGGSKPGKGGKVYEWALKKFKDEETARNFTKWFGDSKVVDGDGNPLTVYHGTDAEFTEFSAGEIGSSQDGKLFGGAGFYFADDKSDASMYGKNVMPAYLKAENVLDARDKNSVFEAFRDAVPSGEEQTLGELKEQYESAKRDLNIEEIDLREERPGFYRVQWKVNGEWEAKPGGLVSSLELSDDPTGRKWVEDYVLPKSHEQFLDVSKFSSEEIAKVVSKKKIDGLVISGSLGHVGDEYVVFSPTQIKSATGNSGKFDPSSGDITKSSDCGANGPGGGGFQPGNTCGKEDGAGEAAQDPKASRQRKQKEKRTRERLYLETELMRATGWTAEEFNSKTEHLNSASEIDAWVKDELDKRQTGAFAEARKAVKPELDKLRAKVVEVWEKDADKISALNAEFKEAAEKHDQLNKKHINLYLAHLEMRNSMGNSEQERAELSKLGKEMDAAKKEADAQGAVARKIWEKKNKIPEKTREKIAAVLRKESARIAEEISPAFADQFKLTEKDIAEFVKRDYSLVVAGNSTEQDKKIRQKSLEFVATAANPEFHNLALKSAVHYKDGVRANANPGVNTERLGKLLDSGVPAKEAIFQSRVPSHSVYSPGDDTRTYIHELGHQIEFGNREAAEYAGDFLRRRTSGDEVVSFADQFGAHYRPDERGSDDEFGKAIQSVFAASYGKTSVEMLANYTGKIYSDGSTEVLSIGLELLHENPKAFAEADPEWFDLVSGVLTGRVLSRTKQEAKAKYQ